MLGVSIFNQNEHTFSFKAGPIFNQVVLADEINRASPKTQSALLECMEESQVTIDGESYPLPEPFFVIATQNPQFQSGTYPLPESQLDRFLMRLSLGYPNVEAEKAMLKQSEFRRISASLMDSETLLKAQHDVQTVHASDGIIDFILRLVGSSRVSQDVTYPLSPRASKAILSASKAWAFLHGRDYVVPEDVQAIFVSVAEHRVRSEFQNAESGQLVSQKLLESTDPLAA
jgi:MoxR-like ATPase